MISLFKNLFNFYKQKAVIPDLNTHLRVCTIILQIFIAICFFCLSKDTAFCDNRSCYEIMNDHTPIPSNQDLVVLDRLGNTTNYHSDRTKTVTTPMGDVYKVYPLSPIEKEMYALFPIENTTNEKVINHGRDLMVYLKRGPEYHIFNYPAEGIFTDVPPSPIDVSTASNVNDTFVNYTSTLPINQQKIDLSYNLFVRIKSYLNSIPLEKQQFMLKEAIQCVLYHDETKILWLPQTEEQLRDPSSLVNLILQFNHNKVLNFYHLLSPTDKLIYAHLNNQIVLFASANVLHQDIVTLLSNTELYETTLKKQLIHMNISA